MAKYVIRWLDSWEFETVPAHETDCTSVEDIFVSKDAAVNAAINTLIRQREALSDVIRRAKKRQQRGDRRRAMREPV